MVILSFFPLLLLLYLLFLLLIVISYIIIIFIILLFLLDIIISTHPVTTVARLITSCHVVFYYETISRRNSSYTFTWYRYLFTRVYIVYDKSVDSFIFQAITIKIHQAWKLSIKLKWD